MTKGWVVGGPTCLGGRRSAVAALVLACSASIAGCTAGGDAQASRSASSTTSSGGSASPSTTGSPSPPSGVSWPLTGQPAAAGATTARPAVAVAVADPPGDAQPRGVASADVVYQEYDRAGASRLVAVFHSTDATVGPVAPTSPVDTRLLTVLQPVFAFSGGPAGFVGQIRPDVATARSAVTHPSLYARSGSSPYDLQVSTAQVRGSAPDAPGPAPLFVYGAAPPKDASGARAATTVNVAVPGRPVETWAFASDGWAGPFGRFANLIVQVVPYKLLTPDRVPAVGSAQIIGSGIATTVAGPVAVTGRWLRPGPARLSNVVDAAGVPVRLVPGRTFVMLAPTGTTVTPA